MKLIAAHVTNFRSVENSEPFTADQVTCLVGKNEAGKSALLLALAALNPHPSTPAILDKERDYPRRYLKPIHRAAVEPRSNIVRLNPHPAQSAHDRNRDQSAGCEPGCPDPVGERCGHAMRDQDAAQS